MKKRMICLILIISLCMQSTISFASTEENSVTQVTYDVISVENNADANDYIYFKNLHYVLSEDKSKSCTLTVYDDISKTKKLKALTISYTYFAGKDYSMNLGKLLGKDSGTIFLTFKYSSKEESDIIEIPYEGEKTSPALDPSCVTLENKYNGTKEMLYVTVGGLSSGDYVYVYKKGSNDSYTQLGSIAGGSTATVTKSYTRTEDLKEIYLTYKKKNEYESIEKQMFIVPEAGVTTYGTEDSDYPSAQIVAKDRTGNDIVEVSGVGSGTVVTLYTSEDKSAKLKSQTINTSGSISVSNIINYPVLYATLRAPDKYESAVISLSPIPAKTTELSYDGIEVQNNSGTNDYINFINLKYTDEEDKSTSVTCNVYADIDKTKQLFTKNISYSYLQGDKNYSLSIGKLLGEESGTVYITFKYATKKESDVIVLHYDGEKYSPEILPKDVSIISKYTGSSEKVYVTVNNLQSGDIIYVYKLLENGTYSQLGTSTCSSSANSVTINFTKSADMEFIYLQLKRTNQYISKEKAKFIVPEVPNTTYGTEDSDLPDISIVPVDQTGDDYIDISGAVSNTKYVVYSDEDKTNKIASGTINTSGKISISNIMSYSALYITLRVPDKYESELIKLIPTAAPKSKITYEKVYVKNYIPNIGDSLCFEGLKYVEEEDKKSNLTLNVYGNADMSSVLYTGTISYSKLQGGDYSISLGDKLGLQSGTLYVSVKYPTKSVSDLIPIAYEGEKTSPKLELSQITVNNYFERPDLSKTKISISVPGKTNDDIVKVYPAADSTEILAYSNQSFEMPVTTKSVFVTIQYYGCYESEKLELILPKARSCSTNYGTVKIENNAGIYPDRISYYEDGEIPQGTVFTVYQDQINENNEKERVKIGSNVIENSQVEVVLEDNGTLGEEKGSIYTTLTYPGCAESYFSETKYDEELLSMRVGIICGDDSDPKKITIINTQQGDIIRVYKDAKKENLILQETAAGSEVQITIPSINVGETVFITNQALNRNESKALGYTIGNISDLGSITMDKDFTSSMYSVSVDFSEQNQVMIGIIKLSGNSSISIDIYDETGKNIDNRSMWATADSAPATYKRWMVLEKPEGGRDVQIYNIKVRVIAYQNETSFKFVTGDADNARELLSGRENAVEISPYHDPHSDRSTSIRNNYVLGEYVPGTIRQGNFYRFTYRNVTDTITLCTSKANLRFCIYEETSENGDLDSIYDSSQDRDARRIEWMSGYSCVYKAREALVDALEIDHTYLLEVYSASQPEGFEEDFYTYKLAIGDPVLCAGTGTVYASASFPIPEKQFSNIFVFNINHSNIPDTALVLDLFPADNSGKRPSELIAIEKFRVRNTSDVNSMWKTCSGFYDSCKYTVIPNSDFSTHVRGRWEIEAYSTTAITIIPGFSVCYYYELGD